MQVIIILCSNCYVRMSPLRLYHNIELQCKFPKLSCLHLFIELFYKNFSSLARTNCNKILKVILCCMNVHKKLGMPPFVRS